MPTRDEIYLSKIAVQEHILSQGQVDECLSIQAQHQSYRPLGVIFIEKGYLSDEGLNKLLHLQIQKTQRIRSPEIERKSRSEKTFGQMAMEEGWITLAQLNHCLRLQLRKQRKGYYIPIGRFLVQKGLLTEEQVQKILMRQHKIPFYCHHCNVSYNFSTHSLSTKKTICKRCGRKLSRQAYEKNKTLSKSQPSTPQLSKPAPENLSWDLKTALGGGDLLGSYRIAKELGRGAMGVVYEAHHVTSGDKVALKVLPANLTLTPRMVQRFHREAHSAAKLQHPNIVPILEIGEDRQIHYYVMKFIAGCSLDVMIEERSLDVRQSAQIIAQAAQAVDYAHSQGIIHRDIKPENIILSEQGQAVITDFGLAKPVGSITLTATGAVMGTPTYMSPEQARGRGGDHLTDIYALGATLYELVTFELPFEGEDYHDVLQKVIKEEIERPRKLMPSLPRDIETIIIKAMDKIPARRYQKAGELARDLELFLQGRPIIARPDSLLSRLGKQIRKRVYALTVILLIACILVLTLLLWVYISQRSREQRYFYLVQNGRDYLAAHDYPRAIQVFTQALRLRPCAEVYFNRSMAFLRRKWYKEALQDFRKGLEYHPSCLSARLQRFVRRELRLTHYPADLQPLLQHIEQELRRQHLLR